MRQVFIDLKKGLLVKDFVQLLHKMDGHFLLISDHTILDATSIMGIYGLNLSKPVMLQIELDTEETMNLLVPFMVK